MATRKSRKRRARPRRAAVTHRPKRAPLRRKRANPSRRRVTHARRHHRRGTRRRSNPSEVVSIAAGAALSQVLGGMIPGFGGSPIVQAAKTYAAGYVLQRFGGRFSHTLFGKAEEGAKIAAVVQLLNAYVMPSVAGAVSSVLPRPANGKPTGQNGIAVVPYPIAPGLLMPGGVPAGAPVNGMASVPRLR